MSRTITASVGPLTAASPNGVALSQSLASAGPLLINGAYASGGVATLPQPRRIGIASVGNDSGITWTISGTSRSGDRISETLVGGSGATVQSVLDYATVTSIVGSGATAGSVTAGTTGVASSAWVRTDPFNDPALGSQCDVSGTVNYTVEASFDDPNSATDPVLPALMTWIKSSDPNVANATASAQSSFAYSPTFLRVTLNSGTGSVTLKAVQYSDF